MTWKLRLLTDGLPFSRAIFHLDNGILEIHVSGFGGGRKMRREILAILARKEMLHKFSWQRGERASSGRRGHALSLGTLRTILLLLSIRSVLQEVFQSSARTRLTLGANRVQMKSLPRKRR